MNKEAKEPENELRDPRFPPWHQRNISEAAPAAEPPEPDSETESESENEPEPGPTD